MATTTPVFAYSPINLDRPSVRLIRLSNCTSEHIRCHIFDAWLDDKDDWIDFEALSYTWGNPALSHTILLNDTVLPVTQNLHAALTALRNHDKDRILWIDAICINQKNGDEKIHQVLQMSEIYKSAEQVIVWLGQSDYANSYVMKEMLRLEHKAIEYAHTKWSPSDERWLKMWHSLDEVPTGTIQQRGKITMKEGYLDFLDRPWFERIWILQEVAHAKRARVFCGIHNISARIFALMPHLLAIRPSPHCQAVLDIMPGSTRQSSWYTQDRSLFSLARKFGNSKASDPRDRIYALLAMASDHHKGVNLDPDYEKTELEVVLATIAFFLGVQGGFSFSGLAPQHWSMNRLLSDLENAGNIFFVDAIESGEDALAVQLLETGKVNLNYQENPLYEAPVWAAAREGTQSILRRLVYSGKVNIGATNCYGWTLLSVAAANGHDESVEMLRNAGCPDQALPVQDRFVNLGAEIMAARKNPSNPRSQLFDENKILVEYKGGHDTDRPLLWWAVKHQSSILVEALLEACPTYVDSMFFRNMNLLSFAAFHRQREILIMLLHKWPSEIGHSLQRSQRGWHPDKTSNTMDPERVPDIVQMLLAGNMTSAQSHIESFSLAQWGLFFDRMGKPL